MIHVAKKLDLAQSPLGIDFVIKRVPNLLDRNVLARLRIQSRTDSKEPQKFNTKSPKKKEQL